VSRTCLRSRIRAGFTLAEVLAALAFMAIVIPVVVEGLRVANLAGVASERKAGAARVAERILNEAVLLGAAQSGGRTGVVQEGVYEFRWMLEVQPWPEDAMRLATVRVQYSVQGREFEYYLSTVVDNATL
jgi:type II secretory pathway pseudopilin PulG